MPSLDVSDVLFDPDFATTISIERAAISVSNSGITSETITTIAATAVVTWSAGATMQRLAEGERLSGSILVHTTTQLMDGHSASTADIVVYMGRRYVVTNVNNWSDYGAGFYCAVCELEGAQR